MGRGNSCKKTRQCFIDCVKESECVTKDQKDFHECIQLESKEGKSCFKERYAFFQCRSGLLNMRFRFRGNGAADVHQEDKSKINENPTF